MNTSDKNDNMSKISVALTTYNGERYIVSQLESIANQTRVPDEVIICDDASKDNTVSLIKNFISDKGFFNWKIFVNQTNVGWKRNFYETIRRTTGDIIFFSDQDDIWLEDKIERMSFLMISNSMDCLLANKYFIDTDDNIDFQRTERSTFTGKTRKIAFDRSFYDRKFMGCCMCISRKVADAYIALNFIDDAHDAQCGRISILLDGAWELDAPVIKYRCHSSNTSGISDGGTFGHSSIEKRLNEIETSINWLQKLLGQPGIEENRISIIQKCIHVQKYRYDYLVEKKSIISLLPYYKYYTGLTMFAGDISYRYHINGMLGKIRWLFLKTFNK